MAKWGEGDPRWIVEERADATNVNNWHWTERDATNWSSEKLKSLLLGLSVENEEGTCEITEVGKCDGEASINNRKGKLIFFYEWSLKATWTGKTKSGIQFKGSLEVPNLSDENDMEDLDISVSLNKDEPETPLMKLMKTKGVDKVREALGSYVGYLKTEFTSGMILPTANGVSKTQTSSQSKAKSDRTQMVQAFTRCAASVDAERGGRFRLLDGNVYGEFMDLVPDEKIVMRWRFNNWPCEHYATISLTLVDRSSETELRAEFRGVPENEEERTRDGWQRYYFESIKMTFGFGARLY
ncbi:hypothetical protein WMY93_017301 [Mugilogobius chulae]|uniref:Activator of Hsp90 ATPase AHSA1-like N-terminal domain-containing protein n=1 Tax=Mugilogobius chulae TaxID=88201 RepID=A0AAW0NS61_9GOBI